MGKVFTITEGLQNLGALKTGGQGSVYKAKRTGEMITAVKLLPTPIFNESAEDRNYATFQNEVQQLKRVNEEPNPNVVKIISSGITESGSLPFIEMEFIEGPDLEELLQPPHDGLFTIREAIKVAEHLSNALSHCHRLNVKHGDIKSNNVKLNVHTGNYVLLDFGLSVMSDEQRRTSLRQAGAIEFMAPEQSTGDTRFQTDVYSFGIILFELLAGRVPYPLRDKTDAARNAVMLAHLEQPLPDLQALRREHLPEAWTSEKKAEEAIVPGWLIMTIEKCLQKKPEDRFSNGVQLHHHIAANSTRPLAAAPANGAEVVQLQSEVSRLRAQNRKLEDELSRLQSAQRTTIAAAAVTPPPYVPPSEQHRKRSNSSSIVLASILTAAVVALIVFFALRNNDSTKEPEANEQTTTNPPVTFKVLAEKTYFHNEPDASTRRAAFIPVNGTVEGTDEKNGFVYTEYTNSRGQVSKGWLRRDELQTLEEWNTAQKAAKEKEEDTKRLLSEARNHLNNGRIGEAVFIYSGLAAQEQPEAMYQLSNMALTGLNANMNCEEALNMMSRANDKGNIDARRTLGLLYLFGTDATITQERGYRYCEVAQDVPRGTQLLVSAVRNGDNAARELINIFNSMKPAETDTTGG